MAKVSLLKTLYRFFLTIIIFVTAVVCLEMVLRSYGDYRKTVGQIEADALSGSRSRLKNNVLDIQALAASKLLDKENALKEEVFYRTQEAIDIAYEIYARNHQEKSPEVISNLILDALRSIRFHNGEGYYFVADMASKSIILYPPDPGFKPQSYAQLGPQWETLAKEFHYQVETYGDGFQQYQWPSPLRQDKSPAEKISFVKLFAPYRWYVGTGLYVESFTETIGEEIIRDVKAFNRNDGNFTLLDRDRRALAGNPADGDIAAWLSMPGEFIYRGGVLYYSGLIDELGWLIGAKVDLGYIRQQIDDQKEFLKKQIAWQMTLIIAGGCLTGLLFFLLLKRFSLRLQRNFDVFAETFRQSAQTNKMIDVGLVNYSEFEELCGPANTMIAENHAIKEGLEQLVDERTEELRNAQDQLLVQERLATLGKLTATVSHELRNPLGTISNALNNIRTALELDNRELVLKSIDVSGRNIQRCDRIIGELLEYGRKARPVFCSVDIDHLIQSTVVELAGPESISLECDLSSGAVITGDEDRLRRAVLNLLTNALQALERFEQPEKTIRLSTRVTGDRVEIVVADNGPGIPADLREKIYEPLFSTKNFGIGLGMSIVKDIVDMHQGHIRLEEPEGGGCKFILVFPCIMKTVNGSSHA